MRLNTLNNPRKIFKLFITVSAHYFLTAFYKLTVSSVWNTRETGDINIIDHDYFNINTLNRKHEFKIRTRPSIIEAPNFPKFRKLRAPKTNSIKSLKLGRPLKAPPANPPN